MEGMGPLGRCIGTLSLSPKVQQQLQKSARYVKRRSTVIVATSLVILRLWMKETASGYIVKKLNKFLQTATSKGWTSGLGIARDGADNPSP